MSDASPDADVYAIASKDANPIAAPDLPYRPPVPRSYRPRLALIGAGGIAEAHLDAYRTAGFDVAAIYNRTLSKADARRDAFFPAARTTDRYDDLLTDTTIEVFDIIPHPEERVELIERALRAGKHVLSQKPFVVDLNVGERLVELAHNNRVKLAVNQNGRWAPHMAYMREAVRSGVIGNLVSCHTSIHWDHSWIAGTAFENMDDVILFDFAIHWFDFLSSLAGDRLQSVVATTAVATSQSVRPPLLAQALVSMEGGQASLIFDAATPFGANDRTYISGTQGSIVSSGPDLGRQKLRVATQEGVAEPDLEGTWFNDGFRGAMGELLCSIEEDREPENSAKDNLKSLALTFAALQSARDRCEVAVGHAHRRVQVPPAD